MSQPVDIELDSINLESLLTTRGFNHVSTTDQKYLVKMFYWYCNHPDSPIDHTKPHYFKEWSKMIEEGYINEPRPEVKDLFGKLMRNQYIFGNEDLMYMDGKLYFVY